MSSLCHQKCLSLNRVWVPVAIITLHRALKLLANTYNNGEPKARVIDPTQDFQAFTWADWSRMKPVENDVGIKSVDYLIRTPKVILLSKYDKMPQQRVQFNRRTIYRMYANTCQYCGKKFSTEMLNIDHVIPRSLGGLSEWTNCTLACVGCNSRKANKTPEQAGMKLLSKPHKPKYTLVKGDIRVKEWQAFLGDCYWNVTLKNDMPDED